MESSYISAEKARQNQVLQSVKSVLKLIELGILTKSEPKRFSAEWKFGCLNSLHFLYA